MPVVPEPSPEEASASERPIPDVLSDEIGQGPLTRRKLIQDIEQELAGRTVVTYFTSSVFPVIVDDSDADMLESIFQCLDLTNGLCLILNSPGGDALAAERIIRLCRSYSQDNFEVLIPKAAKSAATMIALGARRILMAETAELGPIDPQVPRQVDGRLRLMPAHAVITSYEELFNGAVGLGADQRIEPYLQQLDRYNASEIEYLRKLRELSKDIGRQMLRSGTMCGRSDGEIDSCLALFTDWDRTFAHARAIYPDMVRQFGVNVDVLPLGGQLWKLVFELYVRTDNYVSSYASKTIEAARHSVSAPPPRLNSSGGSGSGNA